jgi:hypothetical protein
LPKPLFGFNAMSIDIIVIAPGTFIVPTRTLFSERAYGALLNPLLDRE